MSPQAITSRHNPLMLLLRRLSRHSAAYREEWVAWIEGDHLCRAFRDSGRRPQRIVCAQAWWSAGTQRELLHPDVPLYLLPDSLFKGISSLASPAGVGYVIQLDAQQAFLPEASTVVLDRLQDAGNVGAILRSAAALGVRQVIALQDSVALWSPKVLRAAMGAHFSLVLHEGFAAHNLSVLKIPLIATGSHDGVPLPLMALPQACAWVLGHEGGGVSPEILAQCLAHVRIPQPGGGESLNVAAAAAICFYESLRRNSRWSGAQLSNDP